MHFIVNSIKSVPKKYFLNYLLIQVDLRVDFTCKRLFLLVGVAWGGGYGGGLPQTSVGTDLSANRRSESYSPFFVNGVSIVMTKWLILFGHYFLRVEV